MKKKIPDQENTERTDRGLEKNIWLYSCFLCSRSALYPECMWQTTV